MTKRSSTPADAVLVAIDMSKHRQKVLLERPEGGRRRRMTVMATKADYDRLADDLTIIGKPVIVGFEAILIIGNEQGRRLGDELAGTQVLDAGRLALPE